MLITASKNADLVDWAANNSFTPRINNAINSQKLAINARHAHTDISQRPSVEVTLGLLCTERKISQ